jgi:nitrogen regulatory protein PII
VTYQLLHAYVRPQLAARVVQALLDAGCDDLYVGESRRVVARPPNQDFEYSVAISQKVEPMTRLELLGTDREVERWTGVIRQSASTRRHGDGVVTLVAAVDHFHLSGPEHDPGHAGAEEGTGP